ncbi:MAG: hypothetical protein AB8B99_10565 [Phormidesmis sp.]
MARRKKESSTLMKAERRLSGMKSINSKLDLGNGISVTAMEKEIVALRDKISAYNMLLSKADAAGNEVARMEKALAKMTSRVLMGAAVRYGKDSSEYEMVGGTRESERKRRRVSAVVREVESEVAVAVV